MANRTWFRWDGKLMKDGRYLKRFGSGLTETYQFLWIARPVYRQLIHKGRKP